VRDPYAQYLMDWTQAILEDVYRELWDQRGWWRRKRRVV
jgi:hypothetical protein